MQKQKDRPTLKKYLQQYGKLKKIKSAGDLHFQHTANEKPKEELIKVIVQKLIQIQLLVKKRHSNDPTDQQILSTLNEAKSNMHVLSEQIAANPKLYESENPSHVYYHTTANPTLDKSIKKQIAKKNLLSPVVINKNFDSITIQASKGYIQDESVMTKFGKFGSIAQNSGRSLKRMDIGNSIKIFERQNSITQRIEESEYQENNSPKLKSSNLLQAFRK